MSGFGESSFGSSPFAAFGDDTLVALLTSNASALEALLQPTFFRRISDTALASEALSDLLAHLLVDEATASETLGGYAYLLASLADTAASSEALRIALTEVLADEADASEALTTIYTQVGQLLDRALASDPLLSYLEAVELLFTSAVATELLRHGFTGSLADNAVGSETLVHIMRAVASSLDSALASESLIDSLRIIGTLSDEGEATDALSSVATLLAALESGASASVAVTIGGDQYTAWVLNTENVAVTQYTNYPFNSFVELPDGRCLGAAADGLYLLEGDTDAGTAIQAYLRTPLTDFGYAGLKRLQAALGYTADGDLVFKAVVISPNGVKEEHWYRLEARPTNGTRENRVPVGKGLKSVYWQYELHNIDGADFNIETTRLWPMGLTRKVR